MTPISHRLSRAFAHAAALEEHPESTRKKERLSRQERTALVESFVLKCVPIIFPQEHAVFFSFGSVGQHPRVGENFQNKRGLGQGHGTCGFGHSQKIEGPRMRPWYMQFWVFPK